MASSVFVFFWCDERIVWVGSGHSQTTTILHGIIENLSLLWSRGRIWSIRVPISRVFFRMQMWAVTTSLYPQCCWVCRKILTCFVYCAVFYSAQLQQRKSFLIWCVLQNTEILNSITKRSGFFRPYISPFAIFLGFENFAKLYDQQYEEIFEMFKSHIILKIYYKMVGSRKNFVEVSRFQVFFANYSKYWVSFDALRTTQKIWKVLKPRYCRFKK